MKIKALVTAALCALMLASCSDGEDSSSKSKKDKSQADTSSVSVSDTDESTPDDTSSEDESSKDESSEDESSKDESSEDDSSEADSSKPDDTSSEAPDPDKTYSEPGLVQLAKELYSAQELKGTGDDIRDKFEEEAEKPGTLVLCASLKTEDIFDPFDDLIYNEYRYAETAPDAQIFILSQIVEFDEDGRKENIADGYIFSLAFGCENAASAKTMFSQIADDMKDDLSEDGDMKNKLSNSDDTDTLLISSDELYVGYYRIGSDIYCIGCFYIEASAEDYPEGFTLVYNYKDECGKICKKLGVSSPFELS